MYRKKYAFRDLSLFQTLEERGCEVYDICEKMDWNIKNVTRLSDEELNELWIHIKVVLIDVQKVFIERTNETSPNKKETTHSLETINAIIRIGTQTISKRSSVPHALVETAVIMHSVTLPRVPDKKVKDKVSQFLEKWWILNLVLRDRIITNVLKYLIREVKTSPQHVQRLHSIKLALNSFRSTGDIQELLKITRETKCLSVKEGRALIVHIFTFGEQWIMGIHNNIKVALNNAEPKTIVKYAELYATAWLGASVKNKKVIAVNCVQDFVFHCLRAHRNLDGLLGMLGDNLLILLSCFHNHANSAIKQMISDQYAPLLWKHLKAPGCFVRCNAAEVLFLAYPLQLPGVGRRSSGPHLIKQHEAMTNLLKDSDYRVCHIAVKGVFRILAKHWSDIPDHVINEWMNISLEHTRSSSDPDVRASVFNGIKLAISSQHSIVKLSEFLPKFSDSIYDTNTKVKLAFIGLLIHVRDNVKTRLWDIVPLSHLLACLEEKNSTVLTETIVKLLWPTIFASTDLSEITKRISKLGLENSNATRKLFLYCKQLIDYDIALQLIRDILLKIKEHIKNSPTAMISLRRRNGRHKVDGDKENRDENSPSKSDSDDDSMNNPLIIQVLFDVAAILWTISSEEFVKEIHKEDIDNLKLIVSDVLPNFYNHFKGSPMSESILFLCSLLPESLVSGSTRFSKICIRELHEPNVSDETVLTVVYLLVKWERVDKIIKLLSKLVVVPKDNNAQYNSPKRRKVQDTVVEEKMLGLGLRILKHLLHCEFESVLMNKYHQNLVEFWNSLDFVKGLIKQRLQNNNEADSISEHLLVSLFRNYISLIPFLNRTDVFDASEHFKKVLSWAEREIISHVPQMETIENDTFSINLLKIVLGIGNKMVPQFQATPKLCCAIVLLYSKCLVIPSGIIFMNEALVTMTVLLKFNSTVFKKDESNFLSVVIPSLLTAIMVTLTKYSVDVVIKYTDNLKDLPALLHKSFFVLECTIERYVLSVAYMTIIANTIVACISKELTEILQDMEETNLLDMAFPYVSDKLLKITSQGDKLQLFIEILEKSVATYTPTDMISALLIVHRILKTLSKPPLDELRDITLKAKLCSMNESPQKTSSSRIIASTRTRVVDAILALM